MHEPVRAAASSPRGDKNMRHHLASILSATAVLFCSAGFAQNVKPVLTGTIDESQVVTLEGNTPPAALSAENDHGPVADTMRLDHLLLVLKRSPDSEAALRNLIARMHDVSVSADYHHWLTPQQVGARFGLAREDLEVIQRWLRSHGFSVNRVYANGLIVDFSGSAAQVRETFHTEIHRLVLPNGRPHIANIRDPQIPAALAPAIQGVASLHDFFPRSRSIPLGPVSFDRSTNTWTPHFNINIGGFVYHTLAPYDFATIYDLLPLWK